MQIEEEFEIRRSIMNQEHLRKKENQKILMQSKLETERSLIGVSPEEQQKEFQRQIDLIKA